MNKWVAYPCWYQHYLRLLQHYLIYYKDQWQWNTVESAVWREVALHARTAGFAKTRAEICGRTLFGPSDSWQWKGYYQEITLDSDKNKYINT